MPIISYILKCHFNDFLAGIVIISYLNLLFSISRFNHIKIDNYFKSISICFLCGMLWEYILPLVYSHGTSDMWDIASYVLGGIVNIKLRNKNSVTECKKEDLLWV